MRAQTNLSSELYVGRLSGQICTRSWLPCDGPSSARLAVLATDWSQVPPRSAAVAVELIIDDDTTSTTTKRLRLCCRVNFETGFYHADVDEDVTVGHCLLTVRRQRLTSLTRRNKTLV